MPALKGRLFLLYYTNKYFRKINCFQFSIIISLVVQKCKAMKKSVITILMLLIIITVFSCKKDKSTNNSNTTTPPPKTDNYSSVANFHALNGSHVRSFTHHATTGGRDTTPNGTVISIPANAFVTQSGTAVTGDITIELKDVYNKSDMILNDISTNLYGSGPMKSAGMFYIKAMQGNQALMMSAGRKITIVQPLNGLTLDNQMKPFILQKGDTVNGWVTPPAGSDSLSNSALDISTTVYVFSLYQFNTPADSGTWCNSDNSSYFSAYPQTTLTLNPLDSIKDYHTELFLVFNNLNSMVHVYRTGTNFKYLFAPSGLQCTAVAIGVKNGNLYSSFTPITISSNLTVNFSLSVTTTAAFKSQLNALN
jgi:hypothetical protein